MSRDTSQPRDSEASSRGGVVTAHRTAPKIASQLRESEASSRGGCHGRCERAEGDTRLGPGGIVPQSANQKTAGDPWAERALVLDGGRLLDRSRGGSVDRVSVSGRTNPFIE